jgi:hypothetical protein
MNNRIHFQLTRYVLLSLAMLGIGMVFYGFYHKLIIVQLPQPKGPSQSIEQRNAEHKRIQIWYWNGTEFAKEDKELIFAGNIHSTLLELVSRWISVLEEENLLGKKISVQSVLVDGQGTTAYISFNRSPLAKEHSTFQKLMMIEGLLKTVRTSEIGLKKVLLLVNHKPLQDPQLDFDRPWVTQGYIT